jgi:hypothetical protein
MRSAVTAMQRLRTGFIDGRCFVAEFDIRNSFGEIAHERLLAEVGCTGKASTSSPGLSAIRGLRNHAKKVIGKPYAGKPHTRIERRTGKRACTGTAPLTTNATSVAYPVTGP